MKRKLGIFILAALALCGACGGSEPAAKQAKTARAWQPKENGAPKTRPDTRSAIKVDDEIARRCNIPKAHFDFDSASVTPSASQALDAITKCFMTGPLKGHGMKIVGHADPRGSTEYNFALGQRRAGSVGEYLQSRGLDPNRMVTSSMGELESTGSDESSWAEDRRVEILLAEEKASRGETSALQP